MLGEGASEEEKTFRNSLPRETSELMYDIK